MHQKCTSSWRGVCGTNVHGKLLRNRGELGIKPLLLGNIDSPRVKTTASQPVGLYVFCQERKQSVKAAVCFIGDQVSVAVRRFAEMTLSRLPTIYLAGCDRDRIVDRKCSDTKQQWERLRGDVIGTLKRTARIFGIFGYS